MGLGDAGSDGSRVLTVGVTDPNGNPLGNGQVTLPNGGWWVIGIGPGEKDSSPPPTTDPVGGGGTGGTGGDGGPITDPPDGGTGNSTGGGGGPLATPEPASVVLLALGGATCAAYRRLKPVQPI